MLTHKPKRQGSVFSGARALLKDVHTITDEGMNEKEITAPTNRKTERRENMGNYIFVDDTIYVLLYV